MARDQGAILRPPEADRQVDVVVQQVRQRVRQRQRNLQVGVHRAEFFQPVVQQIAAEVGRRRDPQLAAHGLLARLQRGLGGVDGA